MEHDVRGWPLLTQNPLRARSPGKFSVPLEVYNGIAVNTLGSGTDAVPDPKVFLTGFTLLDLG